LLWHKIALRHKIYHIPLNLPASSLESPYDTFVVIITLNLYNAQSVLWAVMFFLPSNSCAALFYAVRQFYAMAIFLMGRFVTYGVGQQLWGGCELARKTTPHSCWPIALLGAKD